MQTGCLVLLALAGAGCDAKIEDGPEPSGCLCTGWKDHPENPLIEPPKPESIIADPTVLLPEKAPDRKWHLFAHSLLGIHHYQSIDGVHWDRVTAGPPLFAGARPYLYPEGGMFYLFYESFQSLTLDRSSLQIRTSSNLTDWSTPTTVLEPSLNWEIGFQSTNGNPFIMKTGTEYWLYYSANGVLQSDTGFSEPKYIGRAMASSPEGPFEKHPAPILEPRSDDPYRNQAAGSIKVFDEKWRGRWLAFSNGIFHDAEGHSRSAIGILSSDDGLAWGKVCDRPVVGPEGDGWKSAFVYAFDVRRVGNQLWMYYNARDGWREGTERIGLATLNIPRDLSKADSCSFK
ncbi:MAG: family 43 glycosylhydrolase [Nitrospirae bacterium]|nr:family 43 glycosylhydrolase [Nitrospirota bacterium]